MSAREIEFHCLHHQPPSSLSNYGSINAVVVDSKKNHTSDHYDRKRQQLNKNQNHQQQSITYSTTIDKKQNIYSNNTIVESFDIESNNMEERNHRHNDHHNRDPLSPPTVQLAHHEIPENIAELYRLIDDDERKVSFFSTSSTSSAGAISAVDGTDANRSRQEVPSVMMLVAGSSANLCSATLGAGILALPFALYQAGLIIGGLLLIGSAIATIYSIDLLVTACHVYNIYTYEKLAETILGKKIKTGLELSIVLFCIGCAVAYIIAIGDILEKSHLLFMRSRNITMSILWLTAMMPLSMLRKMEHMQFASTFGIASIGTLVFAAAIHLMQDFSANESSDNESNIIIVVDAATTHSIWKVLYTCLWPSNGLDSVLTACPIILFAFSCQCNVCSIFKELPEKVAVPHDHDSGLTSSAEQELPQVNHPTNVSINNRNITDTGVNTSTEGSITNDAIMHKVTVYSVSVCAALYASVSFISLADFGADTKPNMLSSYRPVGVMQVAMSAMAVAVVLAFPLNIFPSRVTVTGWLIGTQFDEKFLGNKPANHGVSFSVIDETPMEAEGLLTNSMEQDDANGVGNQGSGTCVRSDLLHNDSNINNNNNNNNTKTDNIALGAYGKDDDDTDFCWKRHIFLSLLLCTISLIFALVLPNISVVFGLLGGTASSFIGFCVPGLLGMHLVEDLFGTSVNEDTTIETFDETIQQRQPRTLNRNVNSHICSSRTKLAIVSWTLLIGGIGIGILTTAVTFYNTFR